jgi:sugar-phosphatase
MLRVAGYSADSAPGAPLRENWTGTLECDAILFDLDGVLIDSRRCIIRHWQQWAEKQGLKPSDVLRHAHGMRTVDTMRLASPGIDILKEAQLFQAAELADMEGVVPTKGALSLLNSLPMDRWGIVTSGSRELAMGRLRHTGLPIPNALVSGDDVAVGKPEPEAYLLGAERLGKAPHACLAVEDSPAGIRSAVAAGLQVVAVATTHSPEDLAHSPVVEGLRRLRVEAKGLEAGRMIVRYE